MKSARLSALFLLLVSPAALAAQADAGAPFGVLTLVDEVDCGNPADPHRLYEDPVGGSQVKTVLGRSARTLSLDTSAKVFAYKLGAGKGLVAGKAYLLSVEYPEDTGRQIVIINRGAEYSRAVSTGQTIGDARESYTYPAPESLKVPLSQKWETHRTLFFLHDRFQGIKGSRDASGRVYEDTPQSGFWVIIGQFRKKDSPLDEGAAVARIRLFEVPNPDSLAQPVLFPPAGLPRRHVMWREEMADAIIDPADPLKRGVSLSLDWYTYKMRLARFLGVNTFTKDLLEFGHNQNWDSSPYGGHAWITMATQPQLWEQLIDRATSYQLDVLPYYEYAGARGSGSSTGASYGYQRHCRPLGDHANNHYTGVWWSEDACVDVTEQAARDDVRKLLDATIGRFKNRGTFVGAWFRTRNTHWPISFTDATLARFAQDNGGPVPTREALKADAALLQRYYAWWFGERREYLTFIRDWLKQNVRTDAQVLFTPYIDEALRVPALSDWKTPNDDATAWNQIHAQPGPWQWRFPPADWSTYVSEGKFAEMTLRMTPPSASNLATAGEEPDHSAPPADPSRYKDVDDIYMTMPFSRLFTVSSAAQLDTFRSRSGLALVRHFNLNEEDGQNPGAPEGPLSRKVGYFVTDVDRSGPYSMLAEARAVANGDPRFIGYLSSSSFNRGAPEYVRAFNAAYLALPALPSQRVDNASSDAEVVVRRIDTPNNGSYFAVVNTSLQPKKDVKVTLAGTGALKNLVSGAWPARTNQQLTLSFYPGQLHAFQLTPPAAALAGGTREESLGAELLDEASVVEALPAGWE
jgi:hypothetical protein